MHVKSSESTELVARLSLLEHAWSNGHNIDWSETIVLRKERR